MGPQGLKKVAQACTKRVAYLREQLNALEGFSVDLQKHNFCEFVLTLPISNEMLIEQAKQKKILPGVDLAIYDSSCTHQILVAVTEKKSKADLDQLVNFCQDIKKNSNINVG